MRKWYRIVLLSLCTMAPGFASSQDTRVNGDVRQFADAAKNQNMYRGSKIIGADIRDPQDKKLGEIKDILLDSERGEVAFVVVSFGRAAFGQAALGGVPRLPGSNYHAIPWKALQASDDGRHYVLYADRETISKAPAFDQRKWPDLADQKWSTEVDRYWTRMIGQGPSGGITTSSGANSSGTKGERSKENGHQPSR